MQLLLTELRYLDSTVKNPYFDTEKRDSERAINALLAGSRVILRTWRDGSRQFHTIEPIGRFSGIQIHANAFILAIMNNSSPYAPISFEDYCAVMGYGRSVIVRAMDELFNDVKTTSLVKSALMRVRQEALV